MALSGASEWKTVYSTSAYFLQLITPLTDFVQFKSEKL